MSNEFSGKTGQNDLGITSAPKSGREIAEEIKNKGMQCNCDLDNWEPEINTGHSHVCCIHRAAIRRLYAESEARKGNMSKEVDLCPPSNFNG